MIIRISKIVLVAAMALFATLVTFNNLTDYDANFQFVERVLMMDTTFAGNAFMYRAIHMSLLHHVGYIFIIVLEAATAVLCWYGARQMYRARTLAEPVFQRAKKLAIAGLTLGIVTWQLVFVTIGSEWFAMWMSEDWNGTPSAFRYAITLLMVLVYVSMRNDALDVEEVILPGDAAKTKAAGGANGTTGANAANTAKRPS